MRRLQYFRRRGGHPDRTRCVPDTSLRRLFDDRPPEVRKVAVVLYDAEFARWQLWHLQNVGSIFDRMRRVVDPVAAARRARL